LQEIGDNFADKLGPVKTGIGNYINQKLIAFKNKS